MSNKIHLIQYSKMQIIYLLVKTMKPNTRALLTRSLCFVDAKWSSSSEQSADDDLQSMRIPSTLTIKLTHTHTFAIPWRSVLRSRCAKCTRLIHRNFAAFSFAISIKFQMHSTRCLHSSRTVSHQMWSQSIDQIIKVLRQMLLASLQTNRLKNSINAREKKLSVWIKRGWDFFAWENYCWVVWIRVAFCLIDLLLLLRLMLSLKPQLKIEKKNSNVNFIYTWLFFFYTFAVVLFFIVKNSFVFYIHFSMVFFSVDFFSMIFW